MFCLLLFCSTELPSDYSIIFFFWSGPFYFLLFPAVLLYFIIPFRSVFNCCVMLCLLLFCSTVLPYGCSVIFFFLFWSTPFYSLLFPAILLYFIIPLQSVFSCCVFLCFLLLCSTVLLMVVLLHFPFSSNLVHYVLLWISSILLFPFILLCFLLLCYTVLCCYALLCLAWLWLLFCSLLVFSATLLFCSVLFYSALFSDALLWSVLFRSE